MRVSGRDCPEAARPRHVVVGIIGFLTFNNETKRNAIPGRVIAARENFER
jgi:hypothetical protein